MSPVVGVVEADYLVVGAGAAGMAFTQASAFYGVASTLVGGGRIQQTGPEAGLHERATAPGGVRLLRPRAPRANA